jgi:hypothetical protein
MKRIRIATLTLPALLIIGTTRAGQLIEYTAPQQKEIIFQHVLVPFTVTRYVPPYELPKIASEAAASYRTPEEALASYVSASNSQDQAWRRHALERFTGRRISPSELEEMERKNEKANLMDPKIQAKIKDFGKYVLKARVETDQGLVIFASILDRRTGEQLMNVPYALRKEEEIWRSNNMKGGTLGKLFWNFPFGDAEAIVTETEPPTGTPRPPRQGFRLDVPILTVH